MHNDEPECFKSADDDYHDDDGDKLAINHERKFQRLEAKKYELRVLIE